MLNGRVRFGPFEADEASGELWRDGNPVPVQDLPFRVLIALIERPGAIVPRAELTAQLWGSETFVDATAGLNTAIAKLREALGDSAEAPAYIETVPKRGYRFIGAVEPVISSAVRRPEDHRARGVRRRAVAWSAAAALAAILFAAFQLRADRERVRVAVVLFDNETGRPELGRLAQRLTDATVTELTADARLAVIGNAAVLRTERPFRDIAAVRDTVNADYIVIGQIQTVDAATIVRTHLIRARDESHVAVDVSQLTGAGEGPLHEEVGHKVRTAIGRALQQQP